MVKMTIKRVDDSPDEKKWVCKKIDDHPQLEPTEEAAHGPSESLPVDDENLNEEAEDSDDWYQTVPLYLEIEMKEIDHQQPSWESSAENNANILENQHPTHSHETADSAGNSCNDPMDLSGSYSKHKSHRDVTNNVSYKSPIGAHSSKRKFLENAYGDFRNTTSLTGPDRIIQGEADSHFSRAMWSQNTSISPNQKLMNSGEVVAMAMRTMPFTNQNFSMAIHRNSPITSSFVNSEKPEFIAKGNIPNHQQQEAAPRPMKTNYRHFSSDARNYGHSSNAPNSDANRSYNWPLASESNAYSLPIRNEFAERIGENLVNNLQQNLTNYLKNWLSQTCAQIRSNDVLESVRPSKRKKSHAKVPGNTHHCNVCDVTYKTACSYSRHLLTEKHLRKTTYHCNVCDVIYKNARSYSRHLLTEKHLRKANQDVQQQSNLYNFQPNSVSRPFGPTVFETQPQPHLLYLMGDEMRYHQMFQEHAMTAANQSSGGRIIINNTDVQKSHPGTSKSDCNEEFLGHNRPQNNLETKCNAQDTRHINLPVNHASNPQGIYLLPRHPQSENSTIVNPKYLKKKAPQSSSCHKNPLSQIQPENSSVWRRMAKSEPCAIKPNQPENLTVVDSFQKSEDFQSVPCHQLEFFRVYHCLVCSTFNTDCLQELERHVSIDRKQTPFEMLTVSGDELCCKLCDFKTQFSLEMGHHCASIIHLNRVDYYNHVMESGIRAKEKLKLHAFAPVLLFCSACEFATESIDILKAHSNDPSHQHNVLCCIYVSKFIPAVEYCYCRPCSVRTPTKREFLLHVRSRNHLNTLRQYPFNDRMLHDPAHLFFIKELSLDINEAPRVSEQTEGKTFIEREKPHLRKENNEKYYFTENPPPLDLSSAPSISQKLLPVSCCLCQQVFPEINVLVQHLQQIHGVNEAGVKWLITTKVQEEKSLPTEELSNTKAGKPKSIVASPQKSSAADKTLPIQEMSINSSSYQSSVAAGQNLESKSSTCLKAVTSEQNIGMGENLNQEERADADSSSSQQLYKTERMQNPDKLDQKMEGRTGKNFSSSQQLCDTECMQNPGRSSKDSSASQQFYEKERMRNLGEPDQNRDFDQERVNIDPPSSQQFHKTENIPPVGEEKVSNSEENLNSSSSQAKVIVENESEQSGDSKYETQTDDSSSENFSATEHGFLISHSGLSARRKGNDSSSSDHNTLTKKQFCKTENIPPLREENAPNSEENLNSSSSQGEVIVEFESEPNGERKYEIETEDSSGEHFSATEHGSPVPSLDDNASRESNDISSSDHKSVTPERLPAIYDYSIVRTSPLSQSGFNAIRERNESSSSDNNSVTPERLLAIYDSSIGHTSPISQSGLYEWYDSSSSDHNSESHERSPLTDDSSSYEHRSPTSQSGFNASREWYDSSLSDHNSVTHESPAEHESPKSQSGLKARRKKNDSSSSDDIFVEYERLPLRAERSKVNSSQSQHYLLNSENRRSHLEVQHNLNLRENVVNDSPISRLMALKSKHEADNISVMNKNSDDSVNVQIILYDCPNEYEAEFSVPNSPAAINPQIQARKNIENIEISEVFSLTSPLEKSSNIDEEEESMDFDGIVFSDLEEL